MIVIIAWIALSVGIALALSSWIVYDKIRNKRMMIRVFENGSWCEENCKKLEYCMSQHKDPDDAWKALDSWCCECPMAAVMDMLEKEDRERRKKK